MPMIPTERVDVAVPDHVQSVPRLLLVLLRVHVGAVLLVAGWGKLGQDGGFAGPLETFVGRAVEQGAAHGFYVPFLEGVVLADPGLWAGLVVAGEVLLGIALITGTMTRLAGSLAALMFLNYMWMKGAWFWTPSSNDGAFFVESSVVAIGAAGRAWGVDRFLRRRWPGVPLW